MPRPPPFPLFDVRNNVVYDYGGIASGMTGDRLRANYVANYVRPGPSSDTRRGVIVLTDSAAVSYHVGGWPAYETGTPSPDADADGMADGWERAHGLDPADPADGARPGADGYTNLEAYLHELAGPVERGP